MRWLVAWRPAKVGPGKVITGTPIHSESHVVVQPENGCVSSAKSMRLHAARSIRVIIDNQDSRHTATVPCRTVETICAYILNLWLVACAPFHVAMVTRSSGNSSSKCFSYWATSSRALGGMTSQAARLLISSSSLLSPIECNLHF